MPGLEPNNSALVIIDVQGKLAHLVHDKETMHANIQRLVKCAAILKVPVLLAEQNPTGLGQTIPEIAQLLPTADPIPKMSFSCYGCEAFIGVLRSYHRKQVLVAGIEAHVCVYQTVSDLLRQKYEVHVLADAVSSRLPQNKQIALDRMKAEGAIISSTEMAVFELLKTAEHAAFREIIKILK
ncbi:MAG: hydrolase [Candidatus Raymondbacteria bacterium RifOxyA12_full_50_37]|uniref:Hydrolase n=1 Tax=Candidatus Raymondbacteria bacterium RIFOXYD12_FULL_49_13 TaxID=1817890 RepID=A0A1F7FDQ1_UNCRA|nr:MAG: hydrolase [Candidatus Raymondbacteria bacterium RifOxyA12_full_50_37]OGJ94033.1 MAG: hydrolase [Candidatus Raymondbacteria bacterium RIFOXYA2_FULL_49_16]OGJ96859.1 MAG: hydrolase [Candidatus Raymondbacteria bacterium RIFOXYC2_FULL_50_21]OGJ97478.1 MAG: hydrolase [Candidatus Raymondbacteria bacterium RifOxyC12_full_50_8]OGJ99671.1 MAG: hydrolase [Candidatus Raymondbacteria bacterium RifOxyB12_full_50_8]OGK04586.1 MAG: hydrolase [Candidatus Raymondbacteria bacterium RIFOXYD12_FULL_49_13]